MSTGPHLSSEQLLEIFALTPIATAVHTGEDMIIETANDAMLNVWGKDKSVIGKPLLVALPELVGQPFMDLFVNVWRTGVTYQNIDTPADLMIDGKMRTIYFDFEYRALKNADGRVYAILHTATDVTERYFNREALERAAEQEESLHREQALNEELAASNEELSAINEELQQTQSSLHQLNIELEERVETRTRALTASEARVRHMISEAPVPIAVFTGPDMVIESANRKVLEAWGKDEDIIGKPLGLAVPELVGQDFLDILNRVFITGEPYYGYEVKALLEQNGVIEDVYSNFVYQPLKGDNGLTNGIILVAHLVTDLVKARQVVEKSESRFRFMLNAIPQQVWTTKANGDLDYVNQVICDDFGHDMAEIVSLGLQNFIHPEDATAYRQRWTTSLLTGDDYMIEYRLKMADGEYRWHLARAVPLVEDGKISLWLGTNTNIDFQKSNEQRKDEFLSIASHELKTPLTSIKAFNQLMQRSTDTVKTGNFIKKSAEHILRLERLISDLLDVTKINAGKMNYNMEPFDFRQMLVNSIESTQHTSPSHQIILENAVEVTYTGDHFRLEQVVNNFLTNAIKYSPEAARVVVNSKIEQGSIIVSVQDFGIGIEQESLDRLFDRYYRVDNTAMRFEGLGLGLFISSEILKGHHGSFWIESVPGQGSTFYFRLPLTEIEEVKPVKNTDNYYQDSTITISYNKEGHRLDVDWTGYQNFETVQRGGMLMLDILTKNKCHKVLNDNRNVLGTWSEASDWAGKEWFPMMENAGLKYFAWVFSSSAFSQLSAKKSVDVAVGNVTTQFFTDINAGITWLDATPEE